RRNADESEHRSSRGETNRNRCQRMPAVHWRIQMANKLRRREFLKGSAQATAAMALLPSLSGADNSSAGARSSEESCQTKWYPFTEHPDADTCWSLSVGPDGRIYAAACAEGVPGGVVKVVRYNENKDALDYLFSLDEMVNDPGDSGRATQCKIHYSFAPSMSDGIL